MSFTIFCEETDYSVKPLLPSNPPISQYLDPMAQNTFGAADHYLSLDSTYVGRGQHASPSVGSKLAVTHCVNLRYGKGGSIQ